MIVAFLGDVRDSGGDGEAFRTTLDRFGVGEAGLATALAERRFGLLGAGDTISTYTRGSRETVDETVPDLLLVATFLRSSSSSDRSSSSRSTVRAPLGGLEWTAADALD